MEKKKEIILISGKLYRVKAPFEVLPPNMKFIQATGLSLYKVAWFTIPGSILMYVKSERFREDEIKEEEETAATIKQLFFLDQRSKLVRTIPTSFCLFERRPNYQVYQTNRKEDFLEEATIKNEK